MLVKYQPMTNLLNPFFDQFWNVNQPDQECTLSPRTDILERPSDYVIFAELPGVKKDDFKVDIENNILTIRGKKEIHQRGEGEQFARVERQCGNYQRSFRLGEEIDSEKIKASYDSGVLQVILPKSEKVKPKSINIEIN